MFVLVWLTFVAVRAFIGCVPVNHDLIVFHRSCLNVALGAGDICMPPGQGKVGPGAMVKGGRSPAKGVMAIGAVGFVVFGNELSIMGVLVASFALRGRLREARFMIRNWFVAITTGNSAMRSQEGIFRF